MFCYEEMIVFDLDQLGDDAWQTGCPLCGGQCWENTTEEQEREADKVFADNQPTEEL